jgi:hypothetical protein
MSEPVNEYIASRKKGSKENFMQSSPFITSNISGISIIKIHKLNTSAGIY